MYPIWSFTACDSRAASWPATSALPSLGSIRPHSMRSVVVLPAPSGPTSPKISPARHRQVEMVHRRQLAEALGQAAGFDDGFHHCPSRISASAGMLDFSSRPGFSTSILMRYTSFTRSCCVWICFGVNSACEEMNVTRPL